jgi:hypothetical protein
MSTNVWLYEPSIGRVAIKRKKHTTNKTKNSRSSLFALEVEFFGGTEFEISSLISAFVGETYSD